MQKRKIPLLITLSLIFLATSLLTLAQTDNTTFDAEEATNKNVPFSIGNQNTLIGDNAGDNLSSGSFDTLIGSGAGANLNNDSDHTYVGAQAGHLGTTGVDNVMIGARAGYNNTGSDQTFVGNMAGYSNTTGEDNTFIGEDAGYSNTEGSDNVFIGEDAGYENVGGGTFPNPFPNGFPSIFGNDIGGNNTFVGSTAGRQNTNGSHNTAIGEQAGFDLGGFDDAPAEDSSFNTYVGSQAGIDGGAVRANTMVGWAAGWNNEHGDNNVFVGAGAGHDNNRLSDNEGNNNTYVGTFAGARLRRGNNNVFVGHNTGAFNNNAGDFLNNSILIGNNAEFPNAFGGFGTATIIDRAIGIGADVDVDCSNCMVLGGNTPTTRVSVGIATSSPNDMASLELADTDKGFLINRLTNAERATLGGLLMAMDEGMMVYDSDDDALYTWDSAQWRAVTTAGSTDDQNLTGATLTGTTLQIDIEDGTSASVDLASLQDGTGTDDQNLTGASLTGTSLQIDIENGTSASVDLAALQDGTGTDDQTLSLTGNSLAIEDGNNVDLSGFLDNTDAQDLSLSGNTLSLTNDATPVDLSPYLDNTDAQDLDLSGNTLSLTGDATSVDLSAYLDNTDDQNLTGASLAGTTLQIDIENGNSASVDLAGLQDGTGTDDQNLTGASLTGTTLQIDIEDGSSASVDLAALQDGTGTDDQTISFAGTSLSIENGNSVDLSSLQDGTGTDDQTLGLAGTSLSIEDGNAVSLAAFLDNTDNQDLDLSGNTLSLTGDATSVDLTPYLDNTDDQNLTGATLNGTTLQIDIEDGSSTSVDLTPLVGTDDQTLSLNGNTLSIEDGNSVDLTPFTTVHIIQAGARNIGKGKKNEDDDDEDNNAQMRRLSFGHKDANAGVTSLNNGVIIGLSVTADKEITRGDVDFSVTINSVPQEGAGKTITLEPGTNKGFLKFSTPIPFNAGDVLSFEIDPTKNFKPKKADATLAMWVRW